MLGKRFPGGVRVLAYSFDPGNFERGILYFKLKSIIFNPPLLFSPSNVIFLIKLTIMLLILSDKFSGKIRLELFKINFDKTKVLTIFILPIKINFLFYKIFKILSIFRSFSSKF